MAPLVAAPAGRASIDALARHLDAVRGGDRLAPAVVIGSDSVAANGFRRALLRRGGANRGPGLAGVEFTTINRLAATLIEPALVAAEGHVAGRIELLASIRETLRRKPGVFGSVADHRTTEDRLVAFFQEITGLPPEARQRLESRAEGLSADAFRVAREASEAMGRAFTEDRVIELALQELALAPELAVGPLVLVDPDPERTYEARLIQAIARRTDASIVISLTGHRTIDDAYLRRLEAWGVPIESGFETDGRPVGPGASRPDRPRPAALVEVAAPDEEVRAALRQLSGHAAAGVELADMAILYTQPDPYASLIGEQLAAAGIAQRGPGHRSLALTLVGRTLRRMLALATHDADRQSVIGLLNAAPIDRGDGTEAPALRWDRLSRQAGVIDGDHWTSRLAELGHSLEIGEAPASGQGPDGRGRRDDRSAVAELADFVDGLRSALRPPPPTWRAWSQWASGLLDRYLLGVKMGGAAPADWPAGEQRAVAMVDTLLQHIAALDEFGGPPRLDTFEATVLSGLNGWRVPGHDDGQGVFVGPLDRAAGLPFRRIAVVGVVEGRFPRIPREDSLLPDQLKAQAGGLILEKNQITEIDVHKAALVAASSADVTTFFVARGDLRSNRSRAWPERLRGLVDEAQVIASHHQGLLDHGRPMSEDDFALRALLAHVEGGDPVHTHVLARRDAVLAAGLRRHLDRRRTELTAYTGRVDRSMIDPVDRVFSPTALETYAQCPRKYLFQRVLRLQEDERPERIAEITARERGHLVHRVLERFVSEALEAGTVPGPDERWSAVQRARLFEICDEEIKIDQGRGITGGEVRTRLLREELITEMVAFLDTDDELRAERRSTPWAAEFKFGFDDSPALEGVLAGRALRLRGSVDRVDLTDDGGIMVIDYKGGSGSQFKGLDEDPLDGGRRLQLPLYAQAVADALDRTGPRTGLYWLTRKDDVLPVSLDGDLEDDLEEKVGAALDGITEGLFPAVPGSATSWPRVTFDNCVYCDFDHICPTDRQSEWESIQDDPALKPVEVVINDGTDR
ncbi:MAG: PD-(D/E)XK nuclease family protein [Acidimicrobiia bacterium]|nr:PD-(D/E)XK nuclease family protein [Acidimicrobiia bacterium]